MQIIFCRRKMTSKLVPKTILTLAIVFNLLSYGSANIVQKLQESSVTPPWTILVKEIIRTEMHQCSLMILLGQDASMILLNVSSLVKGVTLMDPTNISGPQMSNMKTTLLTNESSSCLGFLILYDQSMDLFLRTSGKELWSGCSKIFFVNIPQSGSIFDKNILLGSNFRYSNQIILAENTNDSFWSIFAVFQFIGKYRIKITRVNSWSPKSGFLKNSKVFPDQNKKNFQGYNFIVAAMAYSPFVIEVDTSLDGKGRFKGIEIELLEVIAQKTNFTYTFVAPADGEWGKELSKGNWTGMIGMVGREEANWAMSDITFSLQRLSYVDFTRTIIFDMSELITPQAKLLPQWLGVVRPFSYNVWIAVVFFIVIVVIMLNAISQVSAFIKQTTIYFSNLGKTVLFCIQIILLRGGTCIVDEHSGRIFVTVWLLSAMIIGIFYTSSLTSFLILPGFSKPIHSFEELVHSDIGWAKVDFGGALNAYLKSATDPILVAVNEGVEWRKTSLDEILPEVVAGTMATWDSAISTKLKVASEYTDKNGQPLVYFTGNALLSERVIWPVSKSATYEKRISEMIARVTESGLINKFYSDIISEEKHLTRQKNTKLENEEESSSGFVVLNLGHFQGPFFILVFGYIVGFLSLIFEIIGVKLFTNSICRK